jgi:transmembrane sensor
MTSEDMALRQAIDWHLQLADGDTEVWHRFVEWLEADAAHAEAYDRVASDDRLLDDRDTRQARLSIVPPPPQNGRRGKGAAFWGAGIAAVLAGTIGLATYLRPVADAPYLVEAAAGSSRQVILADGTRITVHANGRLRLDRANPRFAVIERGEALFQVRHDPAHPFQVEAAGRMIEDLGTVFDVAAQGSDLRVAVAEGSVSFHSGANHILLKPGMVINAAAGDQIEIGHVDPDTVGAWQLGHVDFDDVTLSEVVRQIRLSNGVGIAVSPELGNQRFSGVVRTDRRGDEIVRSLAQLSGTRAVRVAAGWMLERSATQ